MLFPNFRHRKRIRENEAERLKSGLERNNELFRELRAQRHDFMKHLTAVQFMLEQDQTGNAKLYLDELLGRVMETNRFIQGEEGHMAGLLYGVHQQAEALGICVRYLLDAPCSMLPLPALKQSELLGNLLANSVEATEETVRQGGEAEILLKTSVRSGLFLLELSNTSRPVPREILDRLFRLPIPSRKADSTAQRHEGLGTYVISRIVRHHQGTIDFTAENGRFEVKIKMPLIAPKA